MTEKHSYADDHQVSIHEWSGNLVTVRLSDIQYKVTGRVTDTVTGLGDRHRYSWWRVDAVTVGEGGHRCT